MRAIFISYRRDDAEGEAGRLFDDLQKQFGESSVFIDVAGIQAGRDFRKAIDESVATCGILLAVIGKGWLDAKDSAGKRRLDDPSDFVRLETASALKRDIPVIPVLVHGAQMPRPEELPDDLKDLAYRNGCELTHARWASDLQLLIQSLRGYVADPKDCPETVSAPASSRIIIRPAPTPPPPSVRLPFLAIVAIVLSVIVVLAGVGYKTLYKPPDPVVPVPVKHANLFSGSWELTGNSVNGQSQAIKLRVLKLTVNEPAIPREANLLVNKNNELQYTVTLKSGVSETVTWTVDGGTLTHVIQSPANPPGTETRTYRRVQ